MSPCWRLVTGNSFQRLVLHRIINPWNLLFSKYVIDSRLFSSDENICIIITIKVISITIIMMMITRVNLTPKWRSSKTTLCDHSTHKRRSNETDQQTLKEFSKQSRIICARVHHSNPRVLRKAPRELSPSDPQKRVHLT